jgi:geranylgeranyl reductase family protein
LSRPGGKDATMSMSTDVAIVGAGPAGAWAAWRLARAGARVRLFDHSHPREKPCGGGVTGRALALVAGALDAATLPGVAIDRARFEDPRTGAVDVPLDTHRSDLSPTLLIVDRTRFDGALLDAARRAGADHVPERVVDVAADGRPRLRTARGREFAADWIIGADGANSLVRRRLHRPFRRDQLSIAAGVFAHGATSREVVVRFVPDPAGYIWSFPRPDHLAIGICAQADSAGTAGLRRILDQWLAPSGLARGARLQPYAWPIPSLGAADFARERPAGPRCLLVGDAAGLVDPITREGIYFALLSARLAADALAADGDAAARYVAGLRQDIHRELTRAARLKRGFFHGPFTGLLVDALRASAPVRAVMADLIAGLQPYATLRRRLVRTLELRLAWRLLLLELGR